MKDQSPVVILGLAAQETLYLESRKDHSPLTDVRNSECCVTSEDIKYCNMR